jgi:hypothetical protein
MGKRERIFHNRRCFLARRDGDDETSFVYVLALLARLSVDHCRTGNRFSGRARSTREIAKYHNAELIRVEDANRLECGWLREVIFIREKNALEPNASRFLSLSPICHGE